MSLAQRTVTGTAWSVGGSGLSLVILFVRSVLLARWLSVESFGIYGFASALVALGPSSWILAPAAPSCIEPQRLKMSSRLPGSILAWAC